MKYIIAIVILVAIVGGGVLAYQNWWLPKQETKEEEPEESYIKLTSPNGGEQWVVGNTYNITWESAGVDKIDVGYKREGSGAEINGWIGQEVSASQNSYSWTIPSEIFPGPEYSQGSFQIRIGESPFQPGLGTEEISDMTDNYFTITREDETADWQTYRNEVVSPTQEDLSQLSPKEMWLKIKKEVDETQNIDELFAVSRKYASKEKLAFWDSQMELYNSMDQSFKDSLFSMMKTSMPTLDKINVDGIKTNIVGDNATLEIETKDSKEKAEATFVKEDGIWRFIEEVWE